ncbi:MAG: hypothetical protein ACJAZO_002725 [Myxococcota bacterium]|jgi:uncharacterized protein (DUF58 family)
MTWDPTVLSRVRHLHLRARVLTDALLVGEHRSRRVGSAVEFADYLEYRGGMDLRHLDWRVMARSDKLVVKRFETETELACTVVVDLSADMSTGQSGTGGYPDLDRSKAGYALTMAATLLFFLHRHGEPIGLEIVGGGGMTYASLPPRSGKSHLQLLFLQLASVQPAGRAELSPALARIGQRVRRRSLCVVITDGMEEPSEWLPSMKALTRRKTDLRFVHLYDREEWTLNFKQPGLFFSPEGGEALPIDPGGARELFGEVVDEYLAEVRAGVVAVGGKHILAATDQDLATTLRSVIFGKTSKEAAWR